MKIVVLAVIFSFFDLYIQEYLQKMYFVLLDMQNISKGLIKTMHMTSKH